MYTVLHLVEPTDTVHFTLVCLPFTLQMSVPSPTYFHIDDIVFDQLIGRGQFPVFKATLQGKAIAVKKVDCDKNVVPHEVELHSGLSPHLNILPLLGFVHSNDGFTINICMDLAEMSLSDFLHKKEMKPFPQQSELWLIQIASGMNHIHKHGLAHRDLKSANVLLFEKASVAKLCDFGSARVLTNTATMTAMIGTHRWMAPEFNEQAEIRVNQRCDVFSYGMVLYEIFAQKIPFFRLDDLTAAMSIRDGKRPQIPQQVPQHVKQLMQNCWKKNPRDRPTFDKIIQVCWWQCIRTSWRGRIRFCEILVTYTFKPHPPPHMF